MSDLHAINDAINKRAGRKLLPSIGVSIALFAIVWFSLSYYRVIFAGLVALAMVLGVREMVNALKSADINLSFPALTLASIGMASAAWLGGVNGLAVATAISFPWLLAFLLPNGPEHFIRNASAYALTLIYIPFLAGFLILLARPQNGFERMMTFVVLIACNDTLAYFTGLAFGKHTMAPKISPKKTWEGFIGSLVFTTVAGSFAFHYILDAQMWIGALAGLAVVVSGTVGDLIESAIKRDLAIKDMGDLLPGHGGVLDRIDSILYAAPTLWLALEIVRRAQDSGLL
jgi:phosphatidate cytidylyltransferase